MVGKRRAEGSVTRKRGTWYAVLSLGRDSKGTRSRHWSRGFKTKREAEHNLAQLLIEGRQQKETHNTVHFVLSSYIDQDVTSHGRRAKSTTQRYHDLLNNLEPLWGYQVDKLGGAVIEDFYLDLLKGGLSHTTVHHVHNLLFAAFRWAKRSRNGLITRNPYDLDCIEKPRRSKSNARAYTVEQIHTLLAALIATKHANALVFSLATGCRRGETCGLKWNAIDYHRKIAIIRESRYQVRGEVGQKSTKADRIREVPLNNTAISSLQREKERQAERRAFAGDAWAETDHVFTDELGQPLSPMALTNAFGRCAKKAGLPTTRMHDLRHTAATLILSGGGNPTAATEILGHSDKSTTLRLYGHVISLDVIRAAKEIDKALKRRKDA